MACHKYKNVKKHCGQVSELDLDFNWCQWCGEKFAGTFSLLISVQYKFIHVLLSFFFWPLLILGGLFALTCPLVQLVHRSELCCGMKQMAACYGGMKQMAAHCGGMKHIAACRGMNRSKAA